MRQHRMKSVMQKAMTTCKHKKNGAGKVRRRPKRHEREPLRRHMCMTLHCGNGRSGPSASSSCSAPSAGPRSRGPACFCQSVSKECIQIYFISELYRRCAEYYLICEASSASHTSRSNPAQSLQLAVSQATPQSRYPPRTMSRNGPLVERTAFGARAAARSGREPYVPRGAEAPKRAASFEVA